ncbi:MAG: tRNA (adenosine(37)-N6)-threonylcarbamoyltransferase complex transferase subunit TsaD [Oscillospiraceae bacterium]|jgi:N6-L-threonylcarbamoyladenine synthase|nr:tRNA (adenosine(37)-N6)-threonylcarbamoyltransferase complex transferase subunit TsaD [Oscillospiraceae bacterium]
MKILAIETSCDETSCAVVADGRVVLSGVTASQTKEHKLYGGVVPEIASRRHCESIAGLCGEALEQAGTALSEIDALAVTFAPGLIGALLVGLNFAKGVALALDKPLIPVHHIKGHIAANYIENRDLTPPFTALVVSGGHTALIEVRGYTEFNVIGSTLDDAAGEAFDKAARAMGFDYPGGVHIDQAAKSGDITKYKLPYPKTGDEYGFSFSGLKTAVINLINNFGQKGEPLDIPSLAACFQHTVCDILTEKTIKAAKSARGVSYKKIAVSGGVAANSYLREMLKTRAAENDIELYMPSVALCGDNAAMIGCQGYYEYLAGNAAGRGEASGLNAVASAKAL